MAWDDLLIDHLLHKKQSKLQAIRSRVRERLRKFQEDCGDPDEAQIDEAIRHKLVEDFGRSTKELVGDALSSVYWDGLKGHLLGRRVTQKMIIKTLGVSASNLSRWNSRKTLPHPNKFFLALSAWGIDARAILASWDQGRTLLDPALLPAIRDAGLARAVEQIRIREFGREPERIQTHELACARMLYDLDRNGAVLPASPSAKQEEKASLRSKVLERLRMAYPQVTGLTLETVVQVERRWLLPYVLLDLSIPHEWTFLR